MTQTKQNLAETILRVTKEEKPETVSQLSQVVKDLYPVSEKEILDAIIKLQDEGKLILTGQLKLKSQGLSAYLRTSDAYWYWMILTTVIASIAVIFTVPNNASLLSYMRYALAAVYILWLPGYTFIRTLYPKTLQSQITDVASDTAKSERARADQSLDTIERVALSVGMSLAFAPIVGLLLNYSPWGIRLLPITVGLTALTLAFATVALLRENRQRALDVRK